MKEYLDGAKDGFILFSMGSNLKSIMLPEEKRNILLSVFKNLPYKILWKFEDENLPGKPTNVKIGKWLPQNDILGNYIFCLKLLTIKSKHKTRLLIDFFITFEHFLTTAHPNLKLFITHGGLLSTTEAIYHGVPVVGIPILGDQQENMKNAEKLGIGKALDFMKLNYDDLWTTVNEVLNNKM